MKYRQALGLSFINIDGEAFLYEPGSERRWTVDSLSEPLVALLITFCVQNREKKEIINQIIDCTGIDGETANSTFKEFVDTKLIISVDDRNESPSTEAIEKWKNYHWDSPLHFHWHTNKLVKMDYNSDPTGVKDKELMKQYTSSENVPSNFKIIKGVRTEKLVKSYKLNNIRLSEVISSEIYTGKSIAFSIQTFSRFCHLAFGKTGSRAMPVTGSHIWKTSPSGGSRHPTEVYPLILDVPGFSPGLYHYNVKEHGLSLLKGEDFSEFVSKYLIRHENRLRFQPSVVFILTTLFDRSMFRYRESRSYRVIHFDIGHLMQNVSFLARSMNKACYRSYTFDEKKVEETLNINGFTESSMSVIALG